MFEGTKDQDKREAERTLLEIEAAMILAKNNTFGCEIHISGLKIGLSDNTWILAVLKKERAEIEKFLKGEPNKWE